ncbi:N-acetyltransferase family protein [Roseovarius faecimaris]|uniref:GNAT family N-acetyltransferase n=1 Tax=Roseovarius faecimaris TaxID=2494550 RepID=UPI003CCCF7EC
MGADLIIRKARAGDWPALWSILQPVIRAGETYAIDPALPEEAARAMWMEAPAATYLAEQGGDILGTYYIKTNAAGGGAHVCNCGYMVGEAARGRGVAGAMCAHSQEAARALGYRAMQFNMVLCSNTGAIRLWEKMGYDTVGRLPRVFAHPSEGLVDALVMYKWLEDTPA